MYARMYLCVCVRVYVCVYFHAFVIHIHIMCACAHVDISWTNRMFIFVTTSEFFHLGSWKQPPSLELWVVRAAGGVGPKRASVRQGSPGAVKVIPFLKMRAETPTVSSETP